MRLGKGFPDKGVCWELLLVLDHGLMDQKSALGESVSCIM